MLKGGVVVVVVVAMWVDRGGREVGENKGGRERERLRLRLVRIVI